MISIPLQTCEWILKYSPSTRSGRLVAIPEVTYFWGNFRIEGDTTGRSVETETLLLPRAASVCEEFGDLLKQVVRVDGLRQYLEMMAL